MTAVYPYLTITSGKSVGQFFLLDLTDKNRIGRDHECDIVVNDPLCSRVHAIIIQEEDGWWFRDSESRNGAFVDGKKTSEARLVNGTIVRIGSTEFVFQIADQPPTKGSLTSSSMNQTIIRDTPVNENKKELTAWHDLDASQHTRDLLLLYQLSLQLLRCDDPDDVVRIALELISERMHASLVGFLWLNDEGALKLKQLVPPSTAGDNVALSDTLTKKVCHHRHAVWLAEEAPGTDDTLEHFADAVCVPLSQDKMTLGAIHIYLERGRFSQADFDFSISAANVLVASLVSARRQATLQADHQRLVNNSAQANKLIGESKPMQDLQSKIVRVALATSCVLIRGESGSGKELVADAVHKSSARADRPMLSVNCAALPADLMESQLFGHKKGAFTGADNTHAGWFQQADAGTLFLDEVGELTLAGQAKLLRILEGHPFLPVGSTEEIHVDVRVIAATNRDLSELVREKLFREDLFYRLSVFELYIPPLRDRGDDIGLLIDYFLEHFKVQHGQTSLGLAPAARNKMLQYAWPGNVRQLRNVIDSAVVLATGEQIMPHDLGMRDAGMEETDSLRIDVWEQKLIKEALTQSQGNVPAAAKLLGIGRATLYRKIDEYEIER